MGARNEGGSGWTFPRHITNQNAVSQPVREPAGSEPGAAPAPLGLAGARPTGAATGAASERLEQAIAAARKHTHAAKIAEVCAELAARIAGDRRRHASAEELDEVIGKVGLERSDAQTDYGNVLSILERGAEDPAERAIVAAFVAAGVVRALDGVSKGGEPVARAWCDRLCWLSAHAGFDPLAAFPPDTKPDLLHPLQRAIAEYARQIDAGKEPRAGRAELLVATATLGDLVGSGRADLEIAQIVSRLAADVSDPLAQKLITARAAEAPATVVQTGPSEAAIHGRLAPAPRSPFLTVLYALSGYLLLRSVAILIGDFILGLDRKARLELTPTGIELKAKIGLLGRELRDVSTTFPLKSIAVVTREIRFPGMPVYIGLAALLAGTWAGVSFLSWGVQAQSPRLIGYGLLALLLGVALDLAITSLVPGLTGKCRIVVTPKGGQSVCVSHLDATAADRFVADLSRRIG